MGSYTGSVKYVGIHGIGDSYPMVNQFMKFDFPGIYRNRLVKVVSLVTPDFDTAIATSDYTFGIFVADRILRVDACYIMDPIGLSLDVTNYNTMVLQKTTTQMCSATTAYGVIAGEPMEITRAATVANRTLAAAQTVSLKITGSSGGRIINNGILVFVVCAIA